MPASPSSSVQEARKALADKLRQIRTEAGLTGTQLAAEAGWHRTKVSKLEYAATSPSGDDIRTWCRLCGASDRAEDLIAARHEADSLYMEWRRLLRSGLRRQQESQLPLYERTRSFRAYSAFLVPGLLQTRAYTAAVLHAIRQRNGLHDDVDAAVAARMERQRVLHKSGRRFAFLVEESVLRSTVADAGTMAGQLDHLQVATHLPAVSLGVVPMRTGRTRWPAEGFWIFDDLQVNVELISGYLTLQRPTEVAEYARTFSELASMAVYGDAARALITDALATLH